MQEQRRCSVDCRFENGGDGVEEPLKIVGNEVENGFTELANRDFPGGDQLDTESICAFQS